MYKVDANRMPPKRKKDAVALDSLSLSDRKHTRFDDNGDAIDAPVASTSSKKNSFRAVQADCAALAVTPRTTVAIHASGEAYVLDLALNASGDTLAVGSDHGFHAFHLGADNLRSLSLRSEVKGAVPAVHFMPETSTSFYACSGKGDVICWDLRQKQECQRCFVHHKDNIASQKGALKSSQIMLCHISILQIVNFMQIQDEAQEVDLIIAAWPPKRCAQCNAQ